MMQTGRIPAGRKKPAALWRGGVVMLALLAAGCAARTPAPGTLPQHSEIPAAPPRGEPGAFVNLQAGDLRALLGMPAFVRRDGVTEMWRYDGAACRAFFFLYGAPLSVRHVETLPHGAQNAADSGCLAALRVTPAKTS